MAESSVAVDVSTVEQGTDMAMAKRVLRKIDMRLVPLLFVTYMLNFMDKTILSSASVFGLADDTVRFPYKKYSSVANCGGVLGPGGAAV
jgi:hypothetical protein